MFLFFLVFILYIFLIISLLQGFDKIPIFELDDNPCKQTFTIIIPFRNEAENIPDLAQSLMKLNHPSSQYEIIWVNDQSTDNSVPLLTEFIIKNQNWKLLDNKRTSNSPKKDAINTAITQAKNKWVLTTDADCTVHKNWLNSYAQFIEKHPNSKMIAGPVAYRVNKTFLHQFQQMDFLSLIGTTIGSFGFKKPLMCNGANLCYQKEAFLKVNGFEGNNHISSGDDVFLMEKMNRNYPNKVRYLKSKNALVKTKPENTWKSLINQRIRWASKTSSASSLYTKLLGVSVFSMNLIVVNAFLFGLWKSPLFYSSIIFIKWVMDYLLIKKTHHFVEKNQSLSKTSYLLSSLVYPFFVIYIVVISFFKKASWKEREIYN